MNPTTEDTQSIPEIPQLPKGCGYMGREFGANYLDAECYGGQLYDADSCDDEGNLYEPSEYIPCPNCNLKECLKTWAEGALEQGYLAHCDGLPRRYPMKRHQMKVRKAYRKMRKSWLQGWDHSEAENAVSSPKAIGDFCPRAICNQLLAYDQGYPDSFNEPGQDATIFCPSCGASYEIDWTRMPDDEARMME